MSTSPVATREWLLSGCCDAGLRPIRSGRILTFGGPAVSWPRSPSYYETVRGRLWFDACGHELH
jgi:hypothetical protein